MKFLRQGRLRVAATAPSDRIYAVGDVHGRYDLLREMFDIIEAHSARLPGLRRPKVILLGDVVDRGPESGRVMRFLMAAQQRSRRLFVLRGNHEEMLLRVLDGDNDVEQPWLDHGGRATLIDFGIDLPTADDPPGLVGRRLREAMTDEQTLWLRTLPTTMRSGGYFFCHAGVRPGISFERQNPEDLLWIRNEFLYSDTDHGAVVVHGHSESVGVEIRENRIGIDTGAYRTDTLSCLYLEGTKRDVISVTFSASWPDRKAHRSGRARQGDNIAPFDAHLEAGNASRGLQAGD